MKPNFIQQLEEALGIVVEVCDEGFSGPETLVDRSFWCRECCTVHEPGQHVTKETP